MSNSSQSVLEKLEQDFTKDTINRSCGFLKNGQKWVRLCIDPRLWFNDFHEFEKIPDYLQVGMSSFFLNLKKEFPILEVDLSSRVECEVPHEWIRPLVNDLTSMGVFVNRNSPDRLESEEYRRLNNEFELIYNLYEQNSKLVRRCKAVKYNKDGFYDSPILDLIRKELKTKRNPFLHFGMLTDDEIVKLVANSR